MRKGVKFVWDETIERAFSRIKDSVRDAERLYLLDPALKLGMETEASTAGLGARLFQYDEENREYTIAYASRSLRGAERRYTITELEGLALVWSIRKWRVILMGRQVLVKTDHSALRFISACAVVSQRMARWLVFVQEFDLEIRHIPGKTNTVADSLSRIPARDRKNSKRKRSSRKSESSTSESSDADEKRYEWDREGRKKYAPRICLMADLHEGEQTHEWMELIRNAQNDDPRIIARVDRDPLRYSIRDGIVRVSRVDNHDRVLVPTSVAWELVEMIHKYLAHFGTDKVLEFTNRYFAIENLERIVRDVVASCHLCIATKVYARPTRGPPYYELPNDVGEIVSLDLYGPLPRSYDGNGYALVVMDQFSKYTKIYPMRDKKLKTIERVITEFYFRDIGRVPRTILTNRGGQFLTNRWKEFARQNGFKTRRTSPYNPQSNPVERVMRELGRALRAYACDDHRR